MASTNGANSASASARSSSARSPACRWPSRALWETWEGPNGEEVETVAIITTPANRLLGAIAERMPAILPPDAFDPWLDCAPIDAQTAAAFIGPAPEALLEAYPVSTAVNRTANDGPELIEPVSAEEVVAPEAPAPKRTRKPDERQPSLFEEL